MAAKQQFTTEQALEIGNKILMRRIVDVMASERDAISSQEENKHLRRLK